jgi:hypothetical protein
MAIHLGRSSPSASRDRPERRRGRPARRREPRLIAACRSYLVLLPVGFTLPPPLPAARCALTAPFHPCRPPAHEGTGWARRYVFCGTFPGVAPAGRYPAPCLRGARTFLPPPKSETWTESGHPTVWHGKIWDAPPHLSNRPRRSHSAARRTSAIKRRTAAAFSPRRWARLSGAIRPAPPSSRR